MTVTGYVIPTRSCYTGKSTASPDVEFTDLENYNYWIDRVGLGMVSTNDFISNNQAGNSVIVDSYESRRQTAIGVQ